MEAPYVRFVLEGNFPPEHGLWLGPRRLYFGRRPNADGYSRVVGWHEGLSDESHYTRALGAGVILLSGADVSEVTPLDRLPAYADDGF